MTDAELDAAFASLALSVDTRRRLLEHAALLAQWNRTHNLTSVAQTDWAELHFLDSWLTLPLASTGVLLDVGSGGGFPGLVLLAAAPERQAVFFEKVEKKRAFLRTAVARLGYGCAQVASGPFPPAALPELPVTFVSRATWAPAEWLGIAAAVARSGDTVITLGAAEPPPAAPAGWHRDVDRLVLPLSKAPRTIGRFVKDAQ